MPAEQNIDSVAGEDICRGTPVPVRPIDEEDKIELGTLRATVAADELNNAPTYVLPHGLTDQTNLLPTRQVIYIFMGLSVAQACSFLDQTIVATALPAMASDLRSGRASSWVATAYLLTSLSFVPLYGRWSDIFGRKIVLLLSLSVFLTFSIACALSRTMIQLIIFRAFQGIGGGAINVMVLIILSDIVSLKDRGKYQGINEAVIAVSNGLGPLVGGLFSQYVTWRWCFWINLPLASISIVIAIWLLPLKRVRIDVRQRLLQIDYTGSFLTIISSILLLLALNWGGITYPWASVAVLIPLFAGVAILVVFLVWEAKFAKLPIVPVHLFKNKTVVGIYITSVMNGMTFFVILYYMPQFLQLVRGLTPVKASLLLLPFLAPISFVVFLCGQYTSHTGHYRYLIIFGYGVWSIAQGLQCTISEHSSIGRIIGYLVLAAFASGFTFQTSIVACQAAVRRHEMAVATGVLSFVRTFGSTIALAICASLVNNALRTGIRPLGLTAEQVEALLDDPTIINHASALDLDAHAKAVVVAAYTKGFHSVFYLTVVCSIIAFLAAVFMVDQHDLDRADDEELKRQAKEDLEKRKPGREGNGDPEAQQSAEDSKEADAQAGVLVVEV